VNFDAFLADCPARTTLDLIGDRWSVVVIVALGERSRRYSQLAERIGGISNKMLTQTLRNLEGNGLVSRTRLASAPPGASYSLTPLGQTLLVPVRALANWTEEHTSAVLEFRRPDASAS
jgi:DNA-binding HxlR family transcriptional regulator